MFSQKHCALVVKVSVAGERGISDSSVDKNGVVKTMVGWRIVVVWWCGGGESHSVNAVVVAHELLLRTIFLLF